MLKIIFRFIWSDFTTSTTFSFCAFLFFSSDWILRRFYLLYFCLTLKSLFCFGIRVLQQTQNWGILLKQNTFWAQMSLKFLVCSYRLQNGFSQVCCDRLCLCCVSVRVCALWLYVVEFGKGERDFCMFLFYQHDWVQSVMLMLARIRCNKSQTWTSSLWVLFWSVCSSVSPEGTVSVPYSAH